MAYLLRNGAVFLHIPKTGGTWVRQVLIEHDLIHAQLGHQHTDWDRTFWHDKLHTDIKVTRYLLRRAVRSRRAQARHAPDCFRFCFVREPLRWYESWWRFMQGIDWVTLGNETDPFKAHPNAMLNGLGSPDFNTFVHNVNKKRPGYVTELYGWYVRPGIGFVGKMEHLRRDTLEAFALMNIKVDAESLLQKPAANESNSGVPKPVWDPELKKETYRLEYAGYVRYGYPVPKDIDLSAANSPT